MSPLLFSSLNYILSSHYVQFSYPLVKCLFLISAPCDPYFSLNAFFFFCKLTGHSDFYNYVIRLFLVAFLMNFCLLHLYHTFSITRGHDKLSNCLASFGPCSKCWPRKKGEKKLIVQVFSLPMVTQRFSSLSHLWLKDMPGIKK